MDNGKHLLRILAALVAIAMVMPSVVFAVTVTPVAPVITQGIVTYKCPAHCDNCRMYHSKAGVDANGNPTVIEDSTCIFPGGLPVSPPAGHFDSHCDCNVYAPTGAGSGARGCSDEVDAEPLGNDFR